MEGVAPEAAAAPWPVPWLDRGWGETETAGDIGPPAMVRLSERAMSLCGTGNGTVLAGEGVMPEGHKSTSALGEGRGGGGGAHSQGSCGRGTFQTL